MPEIAFKEFLREYAKQIQRGSAAVFVGAGLSRPSGFVDWKGLLKDVANDIGLNVDSETDLVAVAQYHVNARNRGSINQTLVESFSKDASPSEALKLLARLPIDTYWTTNYDTLIEDTLKIEGRKPDTKINPKNLAVTTPDSVATVYKMHGDVSAPDEAVLTREDYETYNEKRQLFAEALKGDLVSKTFLFAGFSFTDPNIDHILSRIRVLLHKDARPHYVLIKRPSEDDEGVFEYNKTKFQHRIDDLKRYSINPVIIDDYAQITELLTELVRLEKTNRVFVSGAAHDFRPLGEVRLHDLARRLGHKIVSSHHTIVAGFGLGLGGAVVLGAAEAFENSKYTITTEQLRFRPFPQQIPNDVDRNEFIRDYREKMLRDVGICIFMAGNRWDEETKTVIESTGVVEEFNIAVKMGACPIPIGATGHAAQTIWEMVKKAPEKYYGNIDVTKEIEALGNSDTHNEGLLKAVFELVKKVQSPQII